MYLTPMCIKLPGVTVLEMLSDLWGCSLGHNYGNDLEYGYQGRYCSKMVMYGVTISESGLWYGGIQPCHNKECYKSLV